MLLLFSCMVSRIELFLVVCTSCLKYEQFNIFITAAYDIVLVKLLPVFTWTKHRSNSEKWCCWANRLGWYHGFWNFKNGNIKICFFYLGHRSLEVIPKGIHLYKCKDESSQESWYNDTSSFMLLFSSLSLLSIKYKCLRRNMFSLLKY